MDELMETGKGRDVGATVELDSSVYTSDVKYKDDIS
jgi:hypothetical protein